MLFKINLEEILLREMIILGFFLNFPLYLLIENYFILFVY